MKQTIRLLLALISLALLASCAPDPRKNAEAYRIRSTADEQAANEAQARKQSEDLHNMELQRLAEEQARRDETHAKKVAALNAIWSTFKIAGSISLVLLLFAVTASISRATYGLANASVIAAEFHANLIALDPATRQFPLLRQVHGNHYALHNPNTGSVLMLNAAREEDRQLITAMGATQLAGAIAYEARQSSDPAGMVMMSPPMIHAQENGLVIGDDFYDKDIYARLPKISEIDSGDLRNG